jgi:dihydroorotate dehydrogenase (fumarate)
VAARRHAGPIFWVWSSQVVRDTNPQQALGSISRRTQNFPDEGRVSGSKAPQARGTEVELRDGMDTSTSYLGFRLPNPFVAGASPLGYQVDGVKQLEDAGFAAVVLPSLFEEQISARLGGLVRGMDLAEPAFGEVLQHFPSQSDYALTPDGYAEHITRLKQVVRIPVIASLNGTSAQAWLKFARIIEQAGADALELNMYEVTTDLMVPATAVEHELVTVVKDLKRTLKIPIAVKLSPFFTAFGHVAHRLDTAGADALVLFNRFYQPDIDVDTARATPRVELSTSAELLLRLRWIAILHGRVRPALAVTGGVASADDGIKALLAGADAVQMTSAILRHGPAFVEQMLTGLETWMETHHVSRLDEMRGRASLRSTADRTAFERANYLRALRSWVPQEAISK